MKLSGWWFTAVASGLVLWLFCTCANNCSWGSRGFVGFGRTHHHTYLNKKVNYRKRTAQRVLLVNSCKLTAGWSLAAGGLRQWLRDKSCDYFAHAQTTAKAGPESSLGSVDPPAHTHLNTKLSYRKGTAQRALLVNSCNVSQSMRVIKVSNNKSDLQGHWQWSHSMGHIRCPFSLQLQLCLSYFPKIKELTWLWTIPFRSNISYIHSYFSINPVHEIGNA